MFLKKIESLLEKRIGLAPESIGLGTVAKAVRVRIEDCGLADSKAYLDLLNRSREELRKLIEAVVVPETWFFRNGNSFAFLVDYAMGEWLPANRNDRFRVLSLPCSTGEEPYSIAMALLDGGMEKERFCIDGVDISRSALERAQSGIYTRGAFRGDDLSFRERYFEKQGDRYLIDPEITKMVRFSEGNLLDEGLLRDQEPYHVVFCRNLLIYLSQDARRRSFKALHRLLTGSGILILGHAEKQVAMEWGFEGIPAFGAFACRKEEGKREEGLKPVFHTQAGPGRTLTENAQVRSDSISTDRTPTLVLLKKEPEGGSSPEEQKDLFREAQLLADQGALTSALELCEACLRESPVHVQTHFLMGLIFEALDNGEKAEECFNKAIYLDPKHSQAMIHLSFILEHRGEGMRASRLRNRARLLS
ncbi:MAG: hypothetical protein JRJ09_03805 [Deltaproteobacteria bacterium]|nr:hypothetical protein [Deltaproteobacteria bacterium]MBW2047637.1 hypothetical protein [Deltaproteobacteria bacterium]MBW2110666.1 hypothetical protein [Deltaproteobacteria bacterium]MBW2351757.1 hypothetical protein [Deltaproteobacteria bacterium]HDZ91905.1 hypothetical protein [Deltaproteobacteria bacterium]